jgi:hypothetical protein
MPEQAELVMLDSGAFIFAQCSIRDDSNFVAFLRGQLKKDRSSLADLIVRIKEAMPEEATNIWAGMGDPLAPASGEIADLRFQECMERTVEEGSKLYASLSSNGLDEILKRLEEMPEGSHLRVLTDCAFLPWEILYPEEFSRVARQQNVIPSPDAKRLWGYRFSTECNMLEAGESGINWGPLMKAHESGPPFVSLNLDSTIEQSQLDAKRKFLPIKHHKDFYTSYLADKKAGEIYDSAKSIFAQLFSKNQPATFLYLYCHGRNTVPYAAGGEETLKFDGSTFVRPHDLSAVHNEYVRAPVVFLNSCTSGQPSPLSFSSFHAVFRRKKALGLIGTAIQIPITFGAAFGCELLRRHYVEGMTLGKAIWKLRRDLIEKGNPLGLFYSLQCPADVNPPGFQAHHSE